MTIFKVPMLSPVLEDFVPPHFRGNVPDDVDALPTTATVTPRNWWMETPKNPTESDYSNKNTYNSGMCAGVLVKLLRWRKNSQRRPVQIPQKKYIQIQALRNKPKKYLTCKTRRIKAINPLFLLAKLRDTYIHLMNNVALSRNIIRASQGPINQSRK